ncbi:MAG TPA: bifunctional hydroxymethylpyrimidine kinase/phosphomethylpyrimidine kinase [Gemmatimonadales bacterium]|nr:bifunctional hydroxymethylpyrimidine kinase/phosphomethylpyrimidine kinase [Gemmatimonadales bacterium]
MADGVRRIALSIAGSDSGGGAGIQADLKTFQAFGCFGTTAIVAVTAQNTLGVSAVHPIPLEIISAQLDALADDLPPDALKSGMLATREVVELVAGEIGGRAWVRYVLDPVMVATSGDRLLDANAIIAVRDRLLPLAACVTPNLDEAELLTGMKVRDPEAMVTAGRALVDLGAGSALIKGGHLASDILVDVLVLPDSIRRYTRPRIATRATHGTGCTLSAAITAGLALGNDLETAVTDGIEYLQQAIRNAPGLGKGNGPVGHDVNP